MKTIILAGGAGIRMNGDRDAAPKPLIEIGGIPILCHIMALYKNQGYNDFIIAGGYKWEMIRDCCRRYPEFNAIVVDTGEQTMTGGRLLRLKSHLAGSDDFMMTYGDGISNIDFSALASHHHLTGKLATVTAVNPPFSYGRLHIEGPMVTAFEEKTPDSTSWINGGFFVLKHQVLDYIRDDQTIWEKDSLPALAAAGELTAYKHTGFWKSMDTMKDKQELENLWESEKATLGRGKFL